MNVVVEMPDNHDAQGFGGWWNCTHLKASHLSPYYPYAILAQCNCLVGKKKNHFCVFLFSETRVGHNGLRQLRIHRVPLFLCSFSPSCQAPGIFTRSQPYSPQWWRRVHVHTEVLLVSEHTVTEPLVTVACRWALATFGIFF